MKTTIYISIVIATSLLILQACGDSSSGPKEGPMTEITGTINAPDGGTPIAGATVFVPREGGNSNKMLSKAKAISASTTAADDCKEPEEAYEVYTCTEADGSFTFDAPVFNGQVFLKIFKGIFSFEQVVDVNEDGGEVGAIAMPSASESFEGEIAVVEGLYDRMQDILAKVGFGEIETDESSFNYGRLVPGTEQFDIFSATSRLFEDEDGDGEQDLFNYDIIFINCGANESPLNEKVSSRTHSHVHAKSSDGAIFLSTEDRAALKDFVESGGVLYTTDWAYDYIEQIFPSYVDYHGADDTPADEPEGWNHAEVGNSGIETDGSILQANMESWLGNVDCFDGEPCLNADNTVHITDFLIGWAVIDGPHTSDVTQWVEGDVAWGGESGVRPLTVSFQAGDGSVFYSSYHTVESEHTPNWRPQERVLQYLVFE